MSSLNSLILIVSEDLQIKIKFYILFVFKLDDNQDNRQNKPHIFGIITSIDLLDYIVKNRNIEENDDNVKQNGCHKEMQNGQTIAEQSEALH